MYICSSRDKSEEFGRQLSVLNKVVLELSSAVEDIKKRLDFVEQQQCSQQLSIEEVMEECAGHKEVWNKEYGTKPAELVKDMEAQLQRLQTWVDHLHEQQTQVEQDRLHCRMSAVSALKQMRENVAQIVWSGVCSEADKDNLNPDANIQGALATTPPIFKIRDDHCCDEYNIDSHNTPLRSTAKGVTGTPKEQL